MENSRDLLLHIGRDGTINFANQSCKLLLQRNPEEVVGRPISELIQTEGTDLVFPIEQNSPLQTHSDTDRFLKFLNHKREEIILKVNWRNFLDHPEIKGLVIRAQEAHDLLQSVEKQQYNQDLFSAAFRINPAICSITDPVTGELLDVNDAWVNTLGYSRDEAIGKTSLELDVWGNPDNRKEALNILRKHGHLQGYEGEIRLRDGSTRTVLASAETVKIGSVERLFFSSVDISEQKKMEQEQKYRRDLFTASFRVNNALCSITDPDSGEILDVNDVWLDTLGYERSEVIGKNILDLNIWKDPTSRISVVQKLRTTDRLNNHEEEIQTKNCDVRTVIYSAEILKIGALEHLFSSARDVTDERRRAVKLIESEERLRQAQKMEAVGQLTGGIAHDFNNLLSVVIGNAEMIEESGGFDRQVNAILRASARGAELTQNLLAFSRKQNLDPIDFQLDNQLEPMLSLLPRTLGATITIRTETDPTLWQCYADPGQVENVLLNLAINARDAMPNGGFLDIRYTNKRVEGSEYVCLTVSDTGSGMDPEILEHVLEPFYTTKKIGEGSGLGLSMVSGFAEQSDGHLFIRSTLGEGTQVELYLPRSKA